LKLLKSPTLSEEEKARSAVENIRSEAVLLRRTRNRSLRDQCVSASGGVCAACSADYGALVPGGWHSVLQAHHRQPLANIPNETVTTVRDLTALCPTCHVLVHLRRPTPLGVPALRRMIAAGQVKLPAS